MNELEEEKYSDLSDLKEIPIRNKLQRTPVRNTQGNTTKSLEDIKITLKLEEGKFSSSRITRNKKRELENLGLDVQLSSPLEPTRRNKIKQSSCRLNYQ